MHGAMRSMSSSTFHACGGGSGTSNELSNSMTYSLSHVLTDSPRLSWRERSDSVGPATIHDGERIAANLRSPRVFPWRDRGGHRFLLPGELPPIDSDDRPHDLRPHDFLPDQQGQTALAESNRRKDFSMQHDFILLDRSGSMQSLWIEALNSVNGYVKKLASDHVDTGVTLATFDKDGEEFKFEVIRDRIIPSTWRPVADQDATPRGMTPLNDAIGRIVALAKAGINGVQYDKVAIIIMTDGLENASREYSHAAAKAL